MVVQRKATRKRDDDLLSYVNEGGDSGGLLTVVPICTIKVTTACRLQLSLDGLFVLYDIRLLSVRERWLMHTSTWPVCNAGHTFKGPGDVTSLTFFSAQQHHTT